MRGNLVMYKKGEPSMITWIKRRPRQNKNVLLALFGATGEGKSYGLNYIGYKIDPEFDPKQQVAFRFKELMHIINNFNNPDHPLSKRKYKVIGFDDCQTEISVREWQSLVNRLFNYLLSTFRHQNFILIFTSPYADFLDSASMKLLHCQIECKGWNKKTKKSALRPLLLEYNSRQKKFYYHSLFVIKNGKTRKMRLWKIDLPPKRIIDAYEQSKYNFTIDLNRRITAKLESMDKEEEGEEKKSILNQGTFKQRQGKRLYVKYKGDVSKVAQEIGITVKNVYSRLGGREKLADLDDIIANP